MIRSRIIIAAAALVLGGTFASAGTTSVNFQSDLSIKGRGSFAGTAAYDSTTDKLTITLDNTSSAKSVITGFAFDVAGNDTAKLEHVLHSKWKDDRNKKGVVIAKPFGKYEAGAGLGGKFGAGASKQGIAMGAEKTFVFDVAGADASTMTASDFFTGPDKMQLVASFAGFKHKKIDRVAGVKLASTVITGDTTTTTPSITTPTIDPPFTKGNGNGDTPGGSGPTIPTRGGGGVTAVPLPPAAYSGIAMLALLGAKSFKRRLSAYFA